MQMTKLHRIHRYCFSFQLLFDIFLSLSPVSLSFWFLVWWHTQEPTRGKQYRCEHLSMEFCNRTMSTKWFGRCFSLLLLVVVSFLCFYTHSQCERVTAGDESVRFFTEPCDAVLYCTRLHKHSHTHLQHRQTKTTLQTRICFVLLHNKNRFVAFAFLFGGKLQSLSPLPLLLLLLLLCHFISVFSEAIPKATEEENALIENFGMRWLLLLLLHQRKCASECWLKHLIEQIDDKLLSFLSWCLWANKFLHSKQPTNFLFHFLALRLAHPLTLKCYTISVSTAQIRWNSLRCFSCDAIILSCIEGN